MLLFEWAVHGFFTTSHLRQGVLSSANSDTTGKQKANGRPRPMRCRSIVEYISVSVEYWFIINYSCFVNMIILFLVTCVFSYHVLQFVTLLVSFFLYLVTRDSPCWSPHNDHHDRHEVIRWDSLRCEVTWGKLGKSSTQKCQTGRDTPLQFNMIHLKISPWKFGDSELGNHMKLSFSGSMLNFRGVCYLYFFRHPQSNVAFWIEPPRLFPPKKRCWRRMWF